MKNPFAREARPKEEKSAGGQLLELVVIVAVALGLALGIQAFLVKPYRIPSPSMVPTLLEGDRVLVNRIGNTFNEPKVGEVVVFNPPAFAQSRAGEGEGNDGQCGVTPPPNAPCPKPGAQRDDVNFIKRVVAGPGDTIAVRNGSVILNGKSQAAKETYTRPCAGGGLCNLPEPITVPAGYWFMMGDNRGSSDDSRYWGPVPREWIIGSAFAKYWPPGRLGLL